MKSRAAQKGSPFIFRRISMMDDTASLDKNDGFGLDDSPFFLNSYVQLN